MKNQRLNDNLTRLLEEIESCASRPLADQADAGQAAKMAHGLFLAHSRSVDSFAKICGSDAIVSQRELERRGIANVKPDCDELKLGTEDRVFFYVGPFRYPEASCGLLFSSSLEMRNNANGTATPFDSGALIGHLTRADPDETPEGFFQRHELPIPGHRAYLEKRLERLFRVPGDYVDGREPDQADPIGLSGGDARRWTHEVGIPVRVELKDHSALRAVFVGRERALETEIWNFLKWCQFQGIDVRWYDCPRTARGGEFRALQRVCIDYLNEKLL
ncbi:MAG: hypothetical protein ACI9VS_004465 [Candidatus Binatia bacterium]|jgi:hypothetical protein